jgi:hypothetical protein
MARKALKRSAKSALRLDVECIECELADLGEDHLGAVGEGEPGSDIAADTDV